VSQTHAQTLTKTKTQTVAHAQLLTKAKAKNKAQTVVKTATHAQTVTHSQAKTKDVANGCVEMFTECNYTGTSYTLCRTSDTSNFKALGYNDAIASIKLGSGTTATLYMNTLCSGNSYSITSDNACFSTDSTLKSIYKQASSIIINDGTYCGQNSMGANDIVEYAGCCYSGACYYEEGDPKVPSNEFAVSYSIGYWNSVNARSDLSSFYVGSNITGVTLYSYTYYFSGGLLNSLTQYHWSTSGSVLCLASGNGEWNDRAQGFTMSYK